MELMGVWCMDLQNPLVSPMVQQYPSVVGSVL